ncbi:PEP-CTERM sorting domain-containing protein [Paucibacter sp. TC2R-5]|uniref:PEP-CTERM sorting domain-containing protein n=1 Tax=Paucibacter sp. TC2R-5 TaxID=2893555 RepID=UPI0021E3FBE8|nr:PEP-CTERM sorting domain-containing protein [Paucibacter sp. TC2R-5]MCV2358056.1 PEP-CTERM sorting domain-containing protein [Paucibacter sp. TC2R-5]
MKLSPSFFVPAPALNLSARVLAAALLTLAAASPASAVPLPFNAYANVYGYIQTYYNSPLLGDVQFSLAGTQVNTYNNGFGGAKTTGVAATTFAIDPGAAPGFDPLYDIITNSGQYGYSYSGKAEVAGVKMRSQIAASTVDIGGPSISPNSSLQAYASAQWNQQFFIAATANRPTGSYGAILVGLTLEGGFPAGTPNYAAQTQDQASTSFTDSAGVSYQSSFTLSTYAGDPGWTGSRTAYKKLLFQYGTAFAISLNQWSTAGNNAAANFFDTGYISSIELPYGATLESGAEQAGLGSASALYGKVTQSATADALNTNWDFGNNGGGFTPPVPEPSSSALMLAGAAALARVLGRRRHVEV